MAEPTEFELAAQEMSDQDLAKAIRDRLREVHVLATEAKKPRRRLTVEFNFDRWGMSAQIMKRL